MSSMVCFAWNSFANGTSNLIIERYEIQAEIRYENARRYYLRIPEVVFQDRSTLDVLINRFRKKGYIECQTLDLVKLNQRIQDSHQEVVLMSDKTIADLLESVRSEIPALYRIGESIAMLDMLAAFAQLATVQEYVRPEITKSLAIKAGRHPIHEKVKPLGRIPVNQEITEIIIGACSEIYSQRCLRN